MGLDKQNDRDKTSDDRFRGEECHLGIRRAISLVETIDEPTPMDTEQELSFQARN